jgi:hypothetical protein
MLLLLPYMHGTSSTSKHSPHEAFTSSSLATHKTSRTRTCFELLCCHVHLHHEVTEILIRLHNVWMHYPRHLH